MKLKLAYWYYRRVIFLVQALDSRDPYDAIQHLCNVWEVEPVYKTQTDPVIDMGETIITLARFTLDHARKEREADSVRKS
jgi:hypothetical protein